MVSYGIDYKVNARIFHALVDAKDLKSAKKKLGRKHGYKDGRRIKIIQSYVVGYF